MKKTIIVTDKELIRQTDVDSAIFACIEECNPTAIPILWDIEMVGEVRDVIEKWLVDNLKVCNSEEFYP